MAATTTTSIQELCPKIVGEAMLWFQNASLFYPGAGRARQYLQMQDLRGQQGVAAQFSQFAPIAMTDASEDVPFETESPLDSSAAVTITASEKEIVVPITDLAKKAVSFGEQWLVSSAGRQMGMAAANKFDSDVMTLFASLSPSYVTTGNPVTPAAIMQTVTALQANNVPGPYAGILHPWGVYGMVTEGSDNPLLNAAASGPNIGGQIWESYQLGVMLGAEWYQHPLVPLTNMDVDYSGAVISPWAIGCVLAQDLRVETERSARDRKDYLVGVIVYGVGVINANYGYELLQAAPAGSGS